MYHSHVCNKASFVICLSVSFFHKVRNTKLMFLCIQHQDIPTVRFYWVLEEKKKPGTHYVRYFPSKH